MRRGARAAMLVLALATGASSALADAATVPPSLPTEWKQWNGHHYRLEADGHLSCYAEDSSRRNTCSLNAPTAKGWPLKCNDPRWGGDNRERTGYQIFGTGATRPTPIFLPNGRATSPWALTCSWPRRHAAT